MNTLTVAATAVVTVFYFLYRYAYSTNTPKIKGLPEVPGLPFLGSLLAIGDCHARKALEWSKTYGPVFQVRLGRRRVVFANTFQSVSHLWITQQSALISRPELYTFHNVVSSSQGYTIGTSPWSESVKRRRKAAATALNRPSVASYMPIIDLESAASIRELLDDTHHGQTAIDPSPYFQRFALNTSLTLNYGFRIKGNINDEQLKEIIEVERKVSNLRSTSNNWQDYLPILRWFGSKNSEAEEMRRRRDRYMENLLSELKERIAKGTDKPCITGNVLKDPETKLNNEELKSICLTMVSAGLDTVPGNLIMGLAYLSTPHGQEIQQKAYAAIMEQYPDYSAWEACIKEEKVKYITALVKEVLRFWTVIPICLPRVNIQPLEFNGVQIPAGTTFLMNAYAADYDPTHFMEPERFLPERYLTDEVTGTSHFAFGAGSRQCIGTHLANRELYTAFVRLIVAFEILPSDNPKDHPIIDALECNRMMTGLTTDPKDFKLKLVARDRNRLEEWLTGSEYRTREL
ncbi:phenylacetate 2-hydroxylase [Pyronema omphalodes]|nr:phenylacetate 2-hydroxylase [Pyronema omphalodes]